MMSKELVIPVLYSGSDFFVVNKPAAISVQNENDQAGLLPHLTKQLGVDKLWLVHRLDKVTSGLLILARDAQAASRLSGYFAKRLIEKYYIALTDNKPRKSQGTVIGDMYKVRDGKWALQQSKQNPAISQFFNKGCGHGKRLFIIKPHSGKTHQIRVLLKSLGSPILGDALYSGTSADRTYLHAYGLRFTDLGTDIELTCQPDSGELFQHSDVVRQLDDYQKPWLLNWPALKSPHQRRSSPCDEKD